VTRKVDTHQLTILLTSLCLISIAFAQTSWSRTYGDSLSDIAYSVQPTADGGYIVAGTTASFGAGVNDVYLIKINTVGDTLWTRAFGDTMEDGGNSVVQAADSGYVVAGYTGSYGAGGQDVWLIKTDAAGNVAWARTCGGTGGDVANAIAPTADGGYIVTGYTWSYGAGSADVYLIKLNAAGDTVWTRAYGGTTDDEGYSVQPTADGGYIVAGVTHSFGSGSADVYLIKTNVSGGTLWTKTYGGTNNDEGYSVEQTADSGYIITGYTSSFGAGNQDVYLIKTNAAGDTLWTRTFGGNLRDWGNAVRQIGGGYIITGVTRSFGAGAQDLYLIKTNSSGDTLWTRTYGGAANDAGNSVHETNDGGWVIAGSTSSFGAGNADVYLIKTDASGYVGLLDENVNPPARVRHLAATVIRSLPPGMAAFDPLGRRVTNPKPGIYFLFRTSRAEGAAPSTAKAILTN
jgi:hypothetical protein